jgi:hypothetical protein
MDWIELAQDRGRWRDLLNALMNLRVPYNVRNFSTNLGPISFSERTLLHGIKYCLTHLTCETYFTYLTGL